MAALGNVDTDYAKYFICFTPVGIFMLKTLKHPLLSHSMRILIQLPVRSPNEAHFQKQIYITIMKFEIDLIPVDCEDMEFSFFFT